MFLLKKTGFHFPYSLSIPVPDLFTENATRTVAVDTVEAAVVVAAMGVAAEEEAASDLFQMNLLTLHLSGTCQTELFRATSISCLKS